MIVRLLAPAPLQVQVGPATVRLEPYWVSSGGHFGYIAAHFTTARGKPAHFLFSGMFGTQELIARAWDRGFEAPTEGPAGRILKALLDQKLAEPAAASDEHRPL